MPAAAQDTQARDPRPAGLRIGIDVGGTFTDFPFQRAATREEIAGMVALLASDRSAYTTGTVVTIDGGMANAGTLI